MKNFYRALRLTFKYKGTIFVVVLTAFLLALFWGMNLSTVYPLVQLTFQGQTAKDYWQKQILQKESRLKKLESELIPANFVFDLSTNASELNKNVSELNKNVSESNTNVSELNKNVSESNTNVSKSDKNASESNTNVSESDKNISESNTNVSELNKNVSESNTNASESNTNVSKPDKNVSESDTNNVDSNLASDCDKNAAESFLSTPDFNQTTSDSKNVLLAEKAKILAELRFLQSCQPWINQYAPNTLYGTIVVLMIFLAVGTLIRAFLTFLNSYYSSKIRYLGIYELRKHFFEKTMSFEINYYNQKGVYDLMTRFTSDMNFISIGITTVFSRLTKDPILFLVCILGAGFISWQLLLFSLVLTPAVLFVLRRFSRKLKAVIKESLKENSNLYRRINETFISLRIIKVFNQEIFEQTRFQKTNQNQLEKSKKIAQYASILSPLNELLRIYMLIGAILVGAWLVLNQKTEIFGIQMSTQPLSMGGIFLFFGFLLGAFNASRRLSDTYIQLQESFAAADRVFEMTDRKSKIAESPNSIHLSAFSDSLRFENVSFFYDSSELSSNTESLASTTDSSPTGNSSSIKTFSSKKISDTENTSPDTFAGKTSDSLNFSATCSDESHFSDTEQHFALEHISFEIKKNETVVIVGPSGCGKSTLLNMIPRFIDPTEGVVLIDGHSLCDVKLFDLRKKIGLITQSPVLFEGTVFENICYGTPDASVFDVENAAKNANAHDFIIHELPDQYQTQVGPKGGLLSGGQRQRIAIARALLKNPEILLLDEATSQIDMKSEGIFHEQLRDFIKTRTTVIVTHRTGALALADRIVVMQNGRIEQIGDHQSLLQTSSYYASLFHPTSF